jgi:hypothetical protein
MNESFRYPRATQPDPDPDMTRLFMKKTIS